MSHWFTHFALIFGIFLTSFNAEAQISNAIILEPRTLSMGGAGVGLADDEYALFHNPAGLAGMEKRRFRAMSVGIEASMDTYSSLGTTKSVFSNFQLANMNQLMGKDIIARTSATTMVNLPHFSLAYIADGQASMNQFNQANPTFRLGDMITHGIQTGMGWNLSKSKKGPEEMRVGVAAKVLWRRGGYYDISTAGFLSASSQGRQYINNLVGSYGMGFGADVGAQYMKHIDNKTHVSFGTSITDIGNTKFSDTHAQTIPMNVSLGVAFQKELEMLKLKFAADLQNLTQETSFVNRTHFGGAISLPMFDFNYGLYQMNLTYGFAFDLWVVRVSALTYAEELGLYYHQNQSRRYMLQVDFSLPI